MPMKSSVKLTPSPWDALVAAVIVVAGVLLAGLLLSRQAVASGGNLTVTISQDGAVIQTVDLTAMSQDRQELTIGGAYTVVILLERERVCVERADCPTQDCVHTGWISRAGQSIVCLPNHLVVQLSGGGADSSVDAVLG